MAEKRMISKVISISEKVNLLPDIFDMLLFTWMIPHTDDFGRLAGSPVKVKALIVPMLDKTIKDIEQSIQRLHDSELIVCYEVTGERFIQIVNFEKHQTGLHKRTQPKFPEPPGHSRNFPEIPLEGKGREENLREEEEKGREHVPAIRDHLHKLINESNLKKYNLHDLDTVFSYIGTVDVEVIEAAIKKGQGKESLRYAINTLNGMINEGITTKDKLFQKPKAGENGAEHGRSAQGIRTSVQTASSRNEGESKIYKGKWDDTVIQMPKVSG